MTASAEPPAAARSRVQLWILIGVFFVPLLAAFLLYYGGWRPSGSTYRGDLIAPARPLPNDVLLNAADQTLDADFLRGKWTLAYIGNGQCDARCREMLVLMRQTRLSLNDKMERVQRVFFVTEECCDSAYLQTEHAGLIVARLDEPADRAMLEAFPRYDNIEVDRAGRVYVIDPLGNLMMSYAAATNPKSLLEDLKKLLKLSHIG